MTVIVALATPEFVALVSDRRLVLVNPNGEQSLKEDNRCKAVLRCGTEAWGYTGLADIGKTPTNEWLAAVLSRDESAEEVLAKSATDEFSRPWIRRVTAGSRRTAFLGVGWSDKSSAPQITTVSNFHGLDGRPQPEARAEFRSHAQRLRRGQPWIVRWVGAELPDDAMNGLGHALDALGSGMDRQAAVAAVVDAVRQTGDVHDSVGGNMLSVVVNRVDPNPGAVMFAPHAETGVTSQFWVDGAEVPKQFGPDYACRGAVMTNAVGGPLNAEGSITETPTGVHVEYPVWFFLSEADGQVTIPSFASPSGDRTGIFVASSPEHLPKLRSSARVQLGTISDRSEFQRLLGDLVDIDDVVFVCEAGACVDIPIGDCLADH